MTNFKKIGSYIADKGSVVINGVSIPNVVGDGLYSIYYSEDQPDGCKEVGFFDFEDISFIKVWCSDCDPKKTMKFSRRDFGGAQIVSFGIVNGDLVFWRFV